VNVHGFSLALRLAVVSWRSGSRWPPALNRRQVRILWRGHRTSGPSADMLAPGLHDLRPIARGGIIVLALLGTVATAQDVTEPALKATFIYNFAKFTTWPDALPTSEPWVICVLGDTAVGDALTRAVEGRALAGHAMKVLQMMPVPPPR
jgi:hypothetical protein